MEIVADEGWSVQISDPPGIRKSGDERLRPVQGVSRIEDLGSEAEFGKRFDKGINPFRRNRLLELADYVKRRRSNGRRKKPRGGESSKRLPLFFLFKLRLGQLLQCDLRELRKQS